MPLRVRLSYWLATECCNTCELPLIGSAPKNLQPIARRIRGEKVRNGLVCSFWTAEKGNWPFSDTLLANMNKNTIFGLVNVLSLKHECKWFFSSRSRTGKCLRILKEWGRGMTCAFVQQVANRL